jgi:hypothetical protein
MAVSNNEIRAAGPRLRDGLSGCDGCRKNWGWEAPERWQPLLSERANGWYLELNDGVRNNVRSSIARESCRIAP